MVRVLFVCLGNICRSPMAEAVFRKMVTDAGLQDQIEVDSAGTGHWHVGEAPHHGTRAILEQNNIEYEGIRARQVRQDDLQRFQYIIAMDGDNLENMHRIAGKQYQGYMARLLDLVPDDRRDDVPDPYYTGNFDEVYHLVQEGCRRLLNFIREREGL